MSSHLGALLRNEISKAMRRKLPYFGVFATGLLCWLIYLSADRLSNAASANAWGYVGFSMQLVFTDIGLIFTLVFAAMLLAEETGTGIIRATLAAPVLRWEFYLAKAAIGLLNMLFLSFAALLFSMALAAIHYHFGAVADAFGVVYSQAEMLRSFLLALVLSWIPLAALTMFGLLISTIIPSPGAAVAAGVSMIYLIDFTKHLVGLDPYIFTKYIGYPWLVLQQAAQGVDFQWQPEVWKMLGYSGTCAFIFFAAGLFLFHRQDLNN
jgi:ABC-type transport system involved in multi-copper enzyme maturation permease subunit